MPSANKSELSGRRTSASSEPIVSRSNQLVIGCNKDG
jgi:hypothetical protein